MSVLSFKKDYDYPAKNPFNKYYTKLVEIKDFNALIDNKPFFDQHVKKQEAYEKLVEMSRNNDYIIIIIIIIKIIMIFLV